MAIGRLSMKVGKAGKAAPHAAYITRQGPYAVRLDKAEKLEATEAGNLPAWARSNPLAFWQAADAYERANGTTYREMEIALPRELGAGHRAALVRAFVRQEIGERHAYQWAIHTPTAADGQEQPHVHLMFSERQVDGIERDPEQSFKRYNPKAPEKGGARKGYGPSAGQTLKRVERAAELKALRARWQDLCNAHLKQAGVEPRIDMRSHAERGTGLEPERKQLPSQWRGQGRDSVIAFREARAERARRERDPAQAAAVLADYLRGPGVTLRGMMESLSPAATLSRVRTAVENGLPPAFSLSEAETGDWRLRGWLRGDALTPQGQAVVATYAAQEQAEQERRAAQERQQQAERERARIEAEQQRQAKQEQRNKTRMQDGIEGEDPGPLRTLTVAALHAEIDPQRPWVIYRGQDGQEKFTDTGPRIVMHDKSDDSLEAALRIAAQKYGGKVDITGSREFRERAARQAGRLGIDVVNPDLAGIALEARHQQMRRDLADMAQRERARWEAVRAQQTRERPGGAGLSPEPVGKSAPESAQAAPAQARPTVPEKQAPRQQEQQQAEREALAYLGERPEERRRRWDDLQRRVQNPPPNTGVVTDREAAVQAWIADRQQRRRSIDPEDARAVVRKIEQYGLTSDHIQKVHLDAVNALKEQIGELERDGKRWWGGNRHARQIESLQSQQAQRAEAGHAELELARDYETFRPRFAAQEHARRQAAWQADVQRHQRLAPAAQAILERDAQAQAQEREREREKERREQVRKQRRGLERDRGGPGMGF